MLHSEYTLPNRFQIRGEILEKIYVEEIEKLKVLNGKMSLDGWSNVHNKPLVCVSVIADKIKVLVRPINTSGHSHNGEYHTQLARGVIESVKCKFESIVKNLLLCN